MNDAVRALTVGRAIPLRGNDIDTDRITPARYLKSITFEGLADASFVDERAAEQKAGRTHPFDDSRFSNSSILIVGGNFGCGSSREHAPQALQRFGIRAIVGESFAEIFASNCTVLGIPLVRASVANIKELHDLVEKYPQTKISVDLSDLQVHAGNLSFKIIMPEGARRALMRGTWDSTSMLLANKEKVAFVINKLPYLSDFTV